MLILTDSFIYKSGKYTCITASGFHQNQKKQPQLAEHQWHFMWAHFVIHCFILASIKYKKIIVQAQHEITWHFFFSTVLSFYQNTSVTQWQNTHSQHLNIDL